MSVPRASAPPPVASAAPQRRSLWIELSDGTAGWVIRLVLTVALGAGLTAACLVGSYLLAAMFPSMFDRWYRYQSRTGGVHPSDELVAWLFVIAGLFYLAAIAWIWSRVLKKHRALWYSAIASIIIIAVTIAAGVLAEDVLDGDEELVISGIAFLGGAALLLLWVEVWRRYGRGRAVTNEQDGLPDVRCPTCQYRMVGLYESRCPECGTAYTLEDLLGRQEFVAARAGGNGAAPIVVPAPMPPAAHADRLPPVPSTPA